MDWLRFANPRAGVIHIVQRKGEYPTKFLNQISTEIAKRVGVTVPVTIKFLKKTAEGGLGAHSGAVYGRNQITINNTWIFETQIETIAHELQHVRQHQDGRLRSVHGEGWTWEGEFWPMSTPYDQQPWEQEASRVGQQIGPAVLAEFKAKGLVPKSKTERYEEEWRAKGLIGKPISEMTEAEVMAVIAERKKRIS